MTTFGEMLKKFRLKAELSLREFSVKVADDPANVSRIERGLKPAPGDDTISRYLKGLISVMTDEERQSFMDMAAISRREIPSDIPNELLLNKLPAFLRTLRAEKPSTKEMEETIDMVKRAFNPEGSL